MITAEENVRLTQTGPGTFMGELLRRYWWPIAATVDLDDDPVRPVRLLSENLVLFRDEKGKLGLVAERCAHRGISLAYGIPQENGLRCAYHGWTYDSDGHVVDMPFEPACLPLKITAYAAEELGGLIWAYMGPEPRPLLPRLELLVRDDLARGITMRPLPCNWVQCNDNSIDPVHFEHLHGYAADWWNRKHGINRRVQTARHLKIAFDVFEYGIYKRRLVEGEPDDADDWTVGHPFLFPHTLVQGVGDSYGYQIRVPVDDTHTLHVRYRGSPVRPGEEIPAKVPVRHLELPYDELGRVEWSDIPLQDEAAWVAQGPLSDRTGEHLVTSDKGVILYHNMLIENAEKVQRGEDPMFVIRDEAKNTPYVHVERERDSAKMITRGIEPNTLDARQAVTAKG
ncbi:MAG TPA: Rieske 2Fe-2S domain-containing protein [Chloroflexota bacterium]|nr:Rieske 2Fe-2S domain-containing protein [Chloroflexota bacterium]